jgi:hypothetical protein
MPTLAFVPRWPKIPAVNPNLWELIEKEVHAIEEVQTRKVIDLARRILPHVTAEDIRNPHDFPELDDPDWQYEDGVLAGIQSVRIALKALQNRIEDAASTAAASEGSP